MKPIYCISGLGADEKVFSHVDLHEFNIVHIQWLRPEKNEDIVSYAKRMNALIPGEKPTLIGLSFGGMICIEISKIRPVDKIILISSVKSREELPAWMKMAGKFKLNKFFPLRSNKLTEPIQNRNLGLETEEERKLARFYRKNVDRVYLEWAIDQILNWNPGEYTTPIYHIHGESDRIFPPKNIHANFMVPAGGHMMIMNRAEIITREIKRILEN